MLSRGKQRYRQPAPVAPSLDAGGVQLEEARRSEREGRIADAAQQFEAAIAAGQKSGEPRVLAEALRRLAILRHHQDDSAQARELCRRSYLVALEMSDQILIAEAMNTTGGLELTGGLLKDARCTFLQALEHGGPNRELRARVEQNLGILANIQGELDEAHTRYSRSLAAYLEVNDQHGCSIAYHNLGMVCTDREEFDQADRYFAESLILAERTGDIYLQGLTLVARAEVDIALQRFENARQAAETALSLFQRFGSRGGPQADAHRMLGMMYRETGRPVLGESRFRTAIELSSSAGAVLSEAEACRELALLHQGLGRNQEALQLLNASYRLFQRLDARVDLIHVGGRVAELEGAYLAVVREWARSIESSDSATFGHCERVATNAVLVARILGLSEQAETTVLIGAYLHDVGKVRVPHEILHKPGPRTARECEVMRMHPVWGVELLADVEFPWDIKPVIRWHHERHDGTGYPDRLKGDEIPIAAQIVGILDEFDTLMTPEGGRPSMSPKRAIGEIEKRRRWWSDRVVDAFMGAMTHPPEERTSRSAAV